MNALSYTFPDARKPVVPVRLAISDALGHALDRQMDPHPEPVLIHALVDSGASLTVIGPRLIEKLRLRQKGFCKIGSLSEEAGEYPNYDVSIALLDDLGTGNELFRIPNIQVVGAPLSTTGIEMLLGMDVLSNFEFTINPRDSTVVLRPL